jgi:hypothetical protein
VKDLAGPVEAAPAQDELVLQLERLPDTPPPPEPTGPATP